jgi:hypothetical protein
MFKFPAVCFSHGCFVAGLKMVAVADISENVNLCICPGCPTYRESKLTGILFCGKGKANETVSKKDCLCPKCPVWKKYKLQDIYYCFIGKAT